MNTINFVYNGNLISVSFNQSNIHISDSYKLIKRTHMKDCLNIIRYASVNRGIFYSRSLNSWIREWKAHNILYKLGIYKERTSSVDLNEKESKLRRFGYFILSLFSWK